MIKVLNMYDVYMSISTDEKIKEIDELCNNKTIKIFEDFNFIYDKKDENYILSTLEKYKDEYEILTLKEHIVFAYGGSGAFAEAEINCFNMISVEMDYILDNINEYYTNDIDLNIFNSDNPQKAMESEFDKIAKEILKERLDELKCMIDKTSLWSRE